MLSHDRIWTAIDRLARVHDLTPSGLAKRAGLDSTTFNKSKRFAADGRPRWPSTESIAKIMDATGVTLTEFSAMVAPHKHGDTRATANPVMPMLHSFNDSVSQARYDGQAVTGQLRQIPVVGMAQAGAGGFFDDAGFPAGEGWDEVAFPGLDAITEHAYALEINGDSMLPLYRAGDRIIVAPGSQVRKGDRVVVKTRNGEVMAKILLRRSTEEVVLGSANPAHEDRVVDASDIDWIARIVWASQ